MHTIRIHILEAKYEFLNLLRQPAYALPTIAFPLVFYIFFGKIVMAMLFGAIIVVALFAIGTLFAHVTLTPIQAIELFAVLVSGSIVFCSIGLAIGVFVSPNAAPPIVNMLFLPMSFLSGLWMPIQGLPKAIQSLAHWLPPYHYSQLALRTIGSGNGESSLVHIAALAAFTAIFTAIAYVGFRRGGTS
jgi:ABC-2 type transport system permease protein